MFCFCFKLFCASYTCVLLMWMTEEKKKNRTKMLYNLGCAHCTRQRKKTNSPSATAVANDFTVNTKWIVVLSCVHCAHVLSDRFDFVKTKTLRSSFFHFKLFSQICLTDFEKFVANSNTNIATSTDGRHRDNSGKYYLPYENSFRRIWCDIGTENAKNQDTKNIGENQFDI